jgi:hypothetical protein
MDILFKVSKRELLENGRGSNRSLNINAQDGKAVRVELRCGDYTPTADATGRYANENYLDMSFSILLPASEYENYPIGAEYLLTPVKDTLFRETRVWPKSQGGSGPG